MSITRSDLRTRRPHDGLPNPRKMSRSNSRPQIAALHERTSAALTVKIHGNAISSTYTLNHS